MGLKAWRVTFLDEADQTIGTSELFTTNPQAAMTKAYALVPAGRQASIHSVKIERTDYKPPTMIPLTLNEM